MFSTPHIWQAAQEFCSEIRFLEKCELVEIAEFRQAQPTSTHSININKHSELMGGAPILREFIMSDLFRRRRVLGGYGRCLIVNRRAAEQFLLEYQA